MAQREDTWLVVLTVGQTNLGVWDTFEGGETDSEEAKYRPGGMNAEISLGGRQTIGNVTLTRYYDEWLSSLSKWLRANCGMVRATIGKVPLNAFKQPVGVAEWYGGTLKRFTPPPHDSMGTDVAKAEVEFTIDSIA
jgi:hypothetical protein